jgi:ribose transport system substrate-binding protein
MSSSRRLRAIVLCTLGVFAASGAAWVGLPPGAPRREVVLLAPGDNGYTQSLIAGARHAAAELDIDLRVVPFDADADANDVNAALERIDTAEVRGVLVAPLDSEAHDGHISALVDRTRVITCRIDAPGSRRTCHVGPGLYSSASACAALVRSWLPRGGRVGVLLDDKRPEASEWRDLFAEVIHRVGSARRTPRWIVSAASADDQDVQCLVCYGSKSGRSVIDSSSSAQRRGRKIVVCEPEGVSLYALAAGQIDAAIVDDPAAIGRAAIKEMDVLLRSSTIQLPLPGLGCLFVRPRVATRVTLPDFLAGNELATASGFN